MQSPALVSQSLTKAANNPDSSTTTTTLIPKQAEQSQSRLVLDASTHQRLWQLWSLLCATDVPLTNASNSNVSNITTPTTWLAHSRSKVPSTVLAAQQAQNILSYDNKGLETAFGLNEGNEGIDERNSNRIGKKL